MNGIKKSYFFTVAFLLLFLNSIDLYAFTGVENSIAKEVPSSSLAELSEKETVYYAFIEAGEQQISHSESNSYFSGAKFLKGILSSHIFSRDEEALKTYLPISRFIEPGLGIKAKIFPFHYFW